MGMALGFIVRWTRLERESQLVLSVGVRSQKVDAHLCQSDNAIAVCPQPSERKVG
jgi:hypothetical protein